jgi:hypothetical protein
LILGTGEKQFDQNSRRIFGGIRGGETPLGYVPSKFRQRSKPVKQQGKMIKAR